MQQLKSADLHWRVHYKLSRCQTVQYGGILELSLPIRSFSVWYIDTSFVRSMQFGPSLSEEYAENRHPAPLKFAESSKLSRALFDYAQI